MPSGSSEQKSRRKFGEHYTSPRVFEEFIFPTIRDHLYEYLWVDLFAGEGNLILPILEHIDPPDRVHFFSERVFLFDIMPLSVEACISNAMKYGIPRSLAEKNIQCRDTLKNYPEEILSAGIPPFHITNPPYLYLGYIMKSAHTQNYLPYFEGENHGFQDLYQLALMNDLRHGLKNVIYIIPANFLFGNSVSNKIRAEFLREYTISKAFIFEERIFAHTGTNVVINFFSRKPMANTDTQRFEGIKIGPTSHTKQYNLRPENDFKAGNEFEDFVSEFKARKPLPFGFYLMAEEVKRNAGPIEVTVIDANDYRGNVGYQKTSIHVTPEFVEYIRNNSLWIRTVDTGSVEGRAGLSEISRDFQVDGILVTKATYRTHPIQLFFTPPFLKNSVCFFASTSIFASNFCDRRQIPSL